MKAIMYHYVRESDSEFPNFKFLHVEDFRRQLDYFAEQFGFVSKDDFIESLSTGEPKPGVVLTFDDAFNDHFSFVLPELKKRGLWGIFYVPTAPFVKQKILDVHRIHLLLGKFGGAKVLSLLTDMIDDAMLVDKNVDDYHNLTYSTQRQNENEDDIAVKRILNYFVSYEYRHQLIDQLMAQLFDDEQQLLHDSYLTTEQMQQMLEQGMVIGSHTQSHPVLSKLDNDGQRSEVEDSFAYLEEHLGKLSPKTFCYPHGGFHTFTPFTEQLLTENQVDFSFNVEPRDITSADLLDRPQALPRYDCNRFPHGSIRQ